MQKSKSITQILIQNRLTEAHAQLTAAAKFATETDNSFSFDDVERLSHLADQVELALADLCGMVK